MFYAIVHNTDAKGAKFGSPSLYGPFNTVDAALIWWQLHTSKETHLEVVRPIVVE